MPYVYSMYYISMSTYTRVFSMIRDLSHYDIRIHVHVDMI